MQRRSGVVDTLARDVTTISEPPIAVPAIPVTLEYATATASDDPQLALYARQSTFLAVMSGLCIAVCFLPMMRFPGGRVIHPVIFAGTIFVAVRCGATMTLAADRWPALRSSVRTIFDILALAGLVVIAVAPIFVTFNDDPAAWQIAAAGAAYLMMALTAYRHVLLYRGLSRICAELNWRGLARSFVSLGYFKFVYETLWLLCCGLPLLAWGISESKLLGEIHIPDAMVFLAFGAFFGCIGYAGIWIWMIIAHARMISLTRIRHAAAPPDA